MWGSYILIKCLFLRWRTTTGQSLSTFVRHFCQSEKVYLIVCFSAVILGIFLLWITDDLKMIPLLTTLMQVFLLSSPDHQNSNTCLPDSSINRDFTINGPQNGKYLKIHFLSYSHTQCSTSNQLIFILFLKQYLPKRRFHTQSFLKAMLEPANQPS